MSNEPVTRRRILRATTGVGVASVATRLQTDSVAVASSARAVVGTSSRTAHERAVDVATSVERALSFDGDRRAVAGHFSESAIADLREHEGIRYVEIDKTVEKRGHVVGEEGLPWGVDRIDADAAQHDGVAGEGADVAIIDTGIDSDHPDLRANLGDGKAFLDHGSTTDGHPCSDENSNALREPWDDDNDHGTHVAGVVAAGNNQRGVVGVAPEATLHAVKALDCRGQGSVSTVAAAVRFVADEGWDAATLSFGVSESSDVMRDAVRYAANRGVLLVAASGNHACENCVDYPAAYPEVVAVSATTSTVEVTPFSSTGPEVELAAPGERIASTVAGGYAAYSGTSVAVPHVAGAAALLHSAGYGREETRSRLRSGAEDLGVTENEQGFGQVNAAAALGTRSGGGGAASGYVGETTTTSVLRNRERPWQRVSLSSEFREPVAIAGPVSLNDDAPCHVRVRSVVPAGVDVGLEEWESQDGVHASETFSLGVFEKGTFAGDSGPRFETGVVRATHRPEDVEFADRFETTPVVLSQLQAMDRADPATIRHRDVSPDAVSLYVQEAEASDGWHASERVGYLAVEPGLGTLSGHRFEVGKTDETVDEGWSRVEFQRSYADPVLLGDFQTNRGTNAATLRYRNLTASGVELTASEERSADEEVVHAPESVGFVVFEGAGPF